MASRLMRGILPALLLLVAAKAQAQRVQFPSPVTSSTSGARAQYAAQVQPPGGWDPYATPGAQPVSPYTPPPTYTPPPQTYTPPPAYTPAPATPAPYSPGTLAPYNPGTSPPPYTPPAGAAPYSPAPSSLYPGDPAGAPAPYYTPVTPVAPPQGTRLLQEIRLQETWLPGGNDDNDLGVNDIETSATFAFPFPFIGDVQTSPLLITPGFALHLWDGPRHVTADMPGQTYDAYLDSAWSPEILPWLSAELGVRVGVYSDFQTFDTHSLRVIGGGMGVIRLSPNLWAKVGAIYLDRADTKIIPAGGIVWRPDEESIWEIVFPRPKISRRLSTVGVVPVWGFVAMDFFGGGSWTIQRADGSSDRVEYDDTRLELGLEWETPSHWKGLFEVGYVFRRELKYVSLDPEQFDVGNTFLLRAGLAF